jgi:hypothetical protein
MWEVARDEAVVEYITIFEEAISGEKMVENIFTHFLTPLFFNLAGSSYR